jgi:putative transposase
MVIRKRLKLKGKALVFVTTTVNEWEPIFKNRAIAELLLFQLAETINHFNVSLVGYVLMPNHLHVLFGFRQVEFLSKLMQSFKILSAKKIKKLVDVEGSNLRNKNGRFALWKPRFDDLLIVSEKQFRVKLDYIHYNPVKAGLVISASDWPFSSASDWLENRPGLISIDKRFKWIG